jgi:hypothetical protein
VRENFDFPVFNDPIQKVEERENEKERKGSGKCAEECIKVASSKYF